MLFVRQVAPKAVYWFSRLVRDSPAFGSFPSFLLIRFRPRTDGMTADMRKIRVHRMVRLGVVLSVLCGSLGALSEAMAQSSAIDASTNWVVAAGRAPSTGKIDIALEVAPRPLIYDRVHEAIIEVANGSPVDREVNIKVLLGEVAHFVDGNFGVGFEKPAEAVQERILVWPKLALPAGARGQVSFRFLVTPTANGDVYIQADVDTSGGLEGREVDHIRETPELPSGPRGFLSQYGFTLLLFIFYVALLYALARRAKGTGALLRVLALGAVVVLIVLSGWNLWDSAKKFGWQAAKCEVLDVRYAVDTTSRQDSGRTGSPTRTTTDILETPNVALRYDGPDGSPLVSSAYRRDMGDLASFPIGTTVDCFYDPDDPLWVVVFREFSFSSVFFFMLFTLAGIGMVWFRLRKRAAAG